MVEEVRLGGGGFKVISLVQKLFQSIYNFLLIVKSKSKGVQNGYFDPKS